MKVEEIVEQMVFLKGINEKMLAGSADDNERRYLYNIIKNVINHLGEMEIEDESIYSLWQDLDGGF